MTRRSSVRKLRTDSSSNMPFFVASAISPPGVDCAKAVPRESVLSIGRIAQKRIARISRCGATLSAEQRPDLREQLARRKRLGDIEIGTHREALRHFGVAALGGEHHDFHLSP